MHVKYEPFPSFLRCRCLHPASEETTAITIIIIIIIITASADATMIITTGQARPRRGRERHSRLYAALHNTRIPFKGMSSLGETKRRKTCTTLWGMD